MRKACANCLYCFYMGNYPSCFCNYLDKEVKATGVCRHWERKMQSRKEALTDAFWNFVADSLKRHNELIAAWKKGGEE